MHYYCLLLVFTWFLFHKVPLLTQWEKKYSVKLNITNPRATNWFLDKVDSLHSHLGMEYVILEGGEGNPFEEQALRPSLAWVGDEYIRLLADLAERIGENTIVTSGTRYLVECFQQSQSIIVIIEVFRIESGLGLGFSGSLVKCV